MNNPIFILTEKLQFSDESLVNALIQQAITAWLTKELCK